MAPECGIRSDFRIGQVQMYSSIPLYGLECCRLSNTDLRWLGFTFKLSTVCL